MRSRRDRWEQELQRVTAHGALHVSLVGLRVRDKQVSGATLLPRITGPDAADLRCGHARFARSGGNLWRWSQALQADSRLHAPA